MSPKQIELLVEQPEMMTYEPMHQALALLDDSGQSDAGEAPAAPFADVATAVVALLVLPDVVQMLALAVVRSVSAPLVEPSASVELVVAVAVVAASEI